MTARQTSSPNFRRRNSSRSFIRERERDANMMYAITIINLVEKESDTLKFVLLRTIIYRKCSSDDDDDFMDCHNKVLPSIFEIGMTDLIFFIDTGAEIIVLPPDPEKILKQVFL